MRKIVFLGGKRGKVSIEKHFEFSDDFEVLYISVSEWNSEEDVAYAYEQLKSVLREVDGVVALTDKAALMLSLCVQEGVVKHGPSLQSVLSVQNKYLSRIIQKQISNLKVPSCYLFDSHFFESAFFLKPSFGHLSSFASLFSDHEAAQEFVRAHLPELQARNAYLSFFLKRGSSDGSAFQFISEAIIPDLEQITVDGFVSGGEVHILGFSRSDFYSGTHSFESFHFPVSYNSDFDERIIKISQELISAHELNDLFFNIEFRLNPKNNEIWLIEINTRMSFQFARMISQVLDFDVLDAAARLSCGEKISLKKNDAFVKKRGSIFIMRREDDAFVEKLPFGAIDQIKKSYRSVLPYYTVDEGKKLSDVPQDTEMFRYGCVLVVGESFEGNRRIYEKVAPELEPEFKEL